MTSSSAPPPGPEVAALPTVAPVPDVLADLEWRARVRQPTEREGLARELAAGPGSG